MNKGENKTEIDIGDYIRTDDGIKQIIEINTGKAKTYYGEFRLDTKYKNSWSISRKNIIKHRPNIIDLVEVGDLVEIEYLAPRYEERVTRLFEVECTSILIEFINTHCTLAYNLENKEWAFGDKKLEPIIKGIVTKEQFEQRMYIVYGK